MFDPLGASSKTPSPAGVILGLIGLGLVVLSWVSWVVAHYIYYFSWYFPRGMQHVSKTLIEPVRLLTLDRFSPREHYNKGSDLSLLWPKGSFRCATIGSSLRQMGSRATG